MRRALLWLGLLAACFGAACRRATTPPACDRCPVILISIDTLRADHLPMFGYHSVETPSLDALRGDSILFTSAYSTVPLTFPSHVSILTGRLPVQSNVRDNLGYRLDASIPTLPKALKARGYATGGAVSAYVLRGSLGLGQSFDFYDDAIAARPDVATGSLQRPGAETAAIAKRWIAEHHQLPFFFFIHLFEPHAPYEPSYDGEIAKADAIVGDVIQSLKQSGLYDRSLIVLLSDHGEGLGQHGEPEHGIFLYREAIHVPLLIKLPHAARRATTESAVVSLIDVAPTIAALTGAPALAGAAGKSLLGSLDPKRLAFSETVYPRLHLGWSDLRSAAGAEHHYIDAPHPELFRWRTDPGETHNAIDDDRRAATAMRAALSAAAPPAAPAPVDAEERKRLAALGYLTAPVAPAGGPLPDPKDRIGEIVQLADAARLSAEGHDDDAVPLLRALLARNPRLADAWEMLASALERSGRAAEAAETYRQAIQATPALSSELALRLGAVLLELERFDDAAAHAMLAEKTNFGGAHLLLARVAMARNDLPRAVTEARTAQQDASTRLQARVVEAQALAREERANEALAIVDAIHEPAQSLEFVRGDALARLGRYDDAVAAFEREIAAYPHQRQPYASLAVVRFLTGRTADGYAALERMARANPTRPTYLFAAHTLQELGDRRGAAEWRRRAERLSR